jgi:hypothetical protein
MTDVSADIYYHPNPRWSEDRLSNHQRAALSHWPFLETGQWLVHLASNFAREVSDGKGRWSSKGDISGRRVAAVPEVVEKLIKLGFSVTVESGAGDSANFSDDDYTAAGASIAPNAAALWFGGHHFQDARPLRKRGWLVEAGRHAGLIHLARAKSGADAATCRRLAHVLQGRRCAASLGDYSLVVGGSCAERPRPGRESRPWQGQKFDFPT